MMLQALLFKFTLELTYVILVCSEWIYESVIYFLNIKKKYIKVKLISLACEKLEIWRLRDKWKFLVGKNIHRTFSVKKWITFGSKINSVNVKKKKRSSGGHKQLRGSLMRLSKRRIPPLSSAYVACARMPGSRTRMCPQPSSDFNRSQYRESMQMSGQLCCEPVKTAPC